MHLYASSLVGLLACASASFAQPTCERVQSLPTHAPTSAYPGSRAPLQPMPLLKLPIGAFRPSGWLGKALELQRDGLAGHLGEISIWLTKKDNAWLRTDGAGEYGWEEVPYWLRGYARIGYILNDRGMIDESKTWIEGAIKSQRDNGDFGPIVTKNGKRDLWAQMLMLQVLQSWFEHAHDERVLALMTRYFRWQLSIPDDQFLKDYWENSRGGDNLSSVYWLYNLTGDAFLLDLATKIDRNTANWRQTANLPNWHVVNIAECFREPAIYSLQSGKAADRDAAYRNFRLVRERYGQVPGGMFGADENARPGFTDPHQASETCSFVEQIASNSQMMQITGDPFWAANTEDVAFNSLPAAFTADYKALRYLTAPNQATSDSTNHHPGVANKGPFFLMNPFSSRCCQHNHSSAWVNYVEHAWMATTDGGLAAILYSAGELTAKAGTSGGAITIAVDTTYPFEEEIRIIVKQTTAGKCPIYLRIPAWAERPSVQVNGHPTACEADAGPYLKLVSDWKPSDRVTLTLPMHIAVRTWAANKNSASVNYGPLTFSLRIEEKYSTVRSDTSTAAIDDSRWQPGADSSKWPSYEILPASLWNYALLFEAAAPDKSFEVLRRPFPTSNMPFTNTDTPITIRCKGKLLPEWKLDEHGLAGTLPQSPVTSNQPVADLTLVPMGGGRLRISAFPVAAP